MSAQVLPALVVTGASGFLGRHLVAAMRERFRIFGLARRSQQAAGIPAHRNVSWFQADIGDEAALAAVFRELRGLEAPRYLVHLAVHYDFTGEPHPEYLRTNVLGLRNVLEACKTFRPDRFIFASSVAACAFPPPGGALDETSAPDGDHFYAITKRRGEQMVKEYREHFPVAVVRLAAMFSDWCEYPPLYFFMRTWLSSAATRRVLGGRGLSAVPYLHVRDAVAFFDRLVEIDGTIGPAETLVASPDGAVSHLEAFEAANLAWRGRRVRPVFTPRPLARLALRLIETGGRLLAERPFERAWMGKYIDLRMAVDGSHTRLRTGWAPNPRRALLRRMPFLVENMKTDPLTWHQRNLAALRAVQFEPNLRLYQLLEDHEDEFIQASMAMLLEGGDRAAFPRYRWFAPDELHWAKQQLFLQLRNAVRTRERAIFREYCRDLAERRRAQGFGCQEVCRAIVAERDLVMRILGSDPRAAALGPTIADFVAGTFLVGVDEIEDAYEEREAAAPPLDARSERA
jgi:nucleoside-diphosphate-sugar epimerase